MIQDIAPHRLSNRFEPEKPQDDSVVFCFYRGNVLVCNESSEKEAGETSLPTIKKLQKYCSDIREKAIYAFSVDDRPVFLLPWHDMTEKLPDGMEYVNMRSLYKGDGRWRAFAAVTANHLNHWYREHRYCGCCGTLSEHSDKERAMVCPKCGNVQYPRISPVIMAAVTDGDRILVTRYAGREYKGLALIAGFVEIGESIEGALEREVMEEVGLKVKNLRYFGSQPWGFSDSVISGFFAELDGSGSIRLDRNELSEAVWLSRDEIPPQNTDISITATMIEAFRTGKV